ncbi:hypothetical protein [Corynebacterium epidermidicanis]|uniref:Pentapeptide MXKDX repeat protein n=1 Tax=Corynebacterium epidermidicanis TaxID=1050174 RepID=A0A0G3GLE7_9CORY|nr:hypothetical protein [Corynebacterium epidermidicanis]AKK01984.1 hypothetical protein CEPID_00450 [Corynebacterium epidermidicanis]
MKTRNALRNLGFAGALVAISLGTVACGDNGDSKTSETTAPAMSSEMMKPSDSMMKTSEMMKPSDSMMMSTDKMAPAMSSEMMQPSDKMMQPSDSMMMTSEMMKH